MSLIEESKRISEALSRMHAEYEETREDILSKREKMTEEFQEASAQGDRSENAAFTEALAKLQGFNAQLARVEQNISALDRVKEEGYVPIGMVIPYSTVRIWCSANEKEYIIKLYPEGVADVREGIISLDSPLGQALYRHEVGDEVSVHRKRLGKSITYRVLEIY